LHPARYGCSKGLGRTPPEVDYLAASTMDTLPPIQMKTRKSVDRTTSIPFWYRTDKTHQEMTDKK
jgi:hypothetical protein